MVLGFCIGGPFIWRMLQRAPERVVAAVPAMPSGFRPEVPDLFYRNNMKNWAPALCERRSDVTMETCSAFLKKMYHEDNDFVFSVTRDFVRQCMTPVLVMPDDTKPHPYAVAEETAMLAPNAQMTFFPWKEPKDRVRVGGTPFAYVFEGERADMKRTRVRSLEGASNFSVGIVTSASIEALEIIGRASCAPPRCAAW